jgi:hypothetical protein
MAKCSNCGSNMTCSCQKRTLPNGSQGCTSCLGKTAGATKGPVPVVKQTKRAPVTIEGKAPVSLNVWGKERYKNLSKFTK